MILSRGDLQITTRSDNLRIATFSLKRVKYLKQDSPVPIQGHSVFGFSVDFITPVNISICLFGDIDSLFV